MKNVLIASFDMEVGGVERSLVSLLNNFDYKSHQVDLMLYSHTGDFMNLIPKYPNLLAELKPYKTFRMTIGQTIKSGKLLLGLARLRAKYEASKTTSGEAGYRQMQYMWKYSLPFLPKLEKKYDIAISYLWPHYFVAEKVQATKKIAWIHTDFSTVDTDRKLDIQIWEKFNHIIAVSEECRNAFIKKYPTLENNVLVMENITSPDLVRSLADEKVNNPMLQDSRFKLITVARLSHAKGIDNAVRALKLLKDKGYQDIVWYVVGYGGDEELIRTMICENDLTDSFILLGKKLNPYPYMKAADLYIQPSRYEGKAVTVTEAQILSKSVIITNYSTARSQVKNGIDGYITELSAKGIAVGIEKLYENFELRNKLANNCKNTDYSNSFELEKLYKTILENRRAYNDKCSSSSL
ncbi:glycosyltransferase [Peribacillus psychrosaccharolyticus]|uniref:glycosyltransferase n=1 Tax=Peribacillus psychrosaccharolyticus TaxID=1407 RepID=UPI003D27CD16